MLLYSILVLIILTLIYILINLHYLKDKYDTLEKVILTLLEKTTDETDEIDKFLQDLIL